MTESCVTAQNFHHLETIPPVALALTTSLHQSLWRDQAWRMASIQGSESRECAVCPGEGPLRYKEEGNPPQATIIVQQDVPHEVRVGCHLSSWYRSPDSGFGAKVGVPFQDSCLHFSAIIKFPDTNIIAKVPEEILHASQSLAGEPGLISQCDVLGSQYQSYLVLQYPLKALIYEVRADTFKSVTRAQLLQH